MPKLSRDAMRTIAALSHVYLNDERLDELWPQVAQLLENIELLARTELGETEPLLIFPLYEE